MRFDFYPEAPKDAILFDFDYEKSFKDLGIDIDANFSTASSFSTYISGTSSRVRSSSFEEFEYVDGDHLFSNQVKMISEEEEMVLVKNDDGSIYLVDYLDSYRMSSGDVINGVMLQYREVQDSLTPEPEPQPESDPGSNYEMPVTTVTITGTEEGEKTRGKRTNDLILGLGGNDRLNGKNGDDILEGGMGNDTLNGKKGDDYLLGEEGADVLIGGKGADVFKTSKGLDVVNDFNLKQGDRVGLYVGTEYEVIDDIDGTLIKVNGVQGDIRMLLSDQDYDVFMAAGEDAIARITR